jgi:hypothetical protein
MAKSEAEQFKDLGNQKYKEAKYDEAIENYTKAIGIFNFCFSHDHVQIVSYY